jgi:D-lactate dehydrogenase (cytochrome)
MNEAKPQFLENVAQDHADFLRDESRRTGKADSISFPRNEAEACGHLSAAFAKGTPVTVQGGRTGISGGAVPEGGHILNLSRLNRIKSVRREGDSWRLITEPGVPLTELRRALEARRIESADDPAAAARVLAEAPPLFLPTDPTEASATLGGMAACNASGARSFLYGAMRGYVEAIHVALANGDILDLRRGREKASGRSFSLTTRSGRRIAGSLPSYRMPTVKNAAGYFAADNMDLLDLFIGSEGTLGTITELELRLIPLPPAIWGFTAFFASEAEAIRFVAAVRSAPAGAAAIEFFNSGALQMLRRQKEAGGAFASLPELKPEWHTAVYAEYHANKESDAEAAVAEAAERMAACGGDPDQAWLACDARELERQKAFRHAVPESVNLTIAERKKKEPTLTKLGTDLSVPDGSLDELMSLYHGGLDKAGLEYVIFGHIGNNHVHVNILPRTAEEYTRGKALYLDWARWVVAQGGSVSAEHGIGKLKRDMLRVMFGDDGIAAMRKLKRMFDPHGKINPGNLFEP